MGHASTFGVLAFSLFLVVCVSASADGVTKQEGTGDTLAQAKQAVEVAKNTIKNVCDKAQSSIDNLKDVLVRVESSKQKVEKENAQADKAPKDNSKAQVIVESIKNIVNTISTSYLDAKGKLEKAISSIEEVQKAAANLKTQCDSHVVANDALQDAYTGTHTKVTVLKGQADKLDTNINNTTIISEAEDIMTKTNNNKKEVNRIVERMTKHCTTELTQSSEIIKEQCQRATEALNSAKGAVDEATNTVAAMKEQKVLAETALENVQTATAVSAAQEDIKKADASVTAAEEIVPKLNNAPQTATNSVITATDSQKTLERALSTPTTAPNTVQATEKAKANPPVGQGTDPDHKDATIQPTNKDLPSQSNKSTNKLKDALLNGAQNVSTTALTGGKAPAPGANNDSAMTVSMPLLVALIASAVLQ